MSKFDLKWKKMCQNQSQRRIKCDSKLPEEEPPEDGEGCSQKCSKNAISPQFGLEKKSFMHQYFELKFKSTIWSG